jgi:hypothetical protein
MWLSAARNRIPWLSAVRYGRASIRKRELSRLPRRPGRLLEGGVVLDLVSERLCFRLGLRRFRRVPILILLLADTVLLSHLSLQRLTSFYTVHPPRVAQSAAYFAGASGVSVTGPMSPDSSGFQCAALNNPSAPRFSGRRAGKLTL